MASLLRNKVAIVTGASSGIGEAIALMFASRGAKVVMCGRNQEALKSVLDKAVKISGGKPDMHLTVQGDLNNQLFRKYLVDQTIEKFGRLDILVPNAGITRSKQPVMDVTEKTYNDIMDTNLKSVIFLIQQAVPHLEKTKGNIVNMSSIASTVVVPATTIYSLSKIAIDTLTKFLSVDLGPKGIRVNVVNPGFIATKILRHHGEKVDLVNANVTETETESSPFKDKMLTLDDVAETVAFLASGAAGCITGESVKIDRGRNLTGSPNWSAPVSNK